MDRINEMLIGCITLIGGFLTKRIFNRQDQLDERVSALEKTVVTKNDLHSIDNNIALILKHLLDKKS